MAKARRDLSNAMDPIQLQRCTFLGPFAGADDDEDDDESAPAPAPAVDRELPPDCRSNPFKYLPPRMELSAAELELARKFDNNDTSSGYLTSLIANLRRGQPAAMRQANRERFQRLRKEVDQRGFTLPVAFVELIETDEYVDRLRHGNIHLRLPDALAPLPGRPDCQLLLMFADYQGCGNWHLLLLPDGGHAVVFSDYGFGVTEPNGYRPNLNKTLILQCADDFCTWIVNFFFECIAEDQKHERMLRQFPGQ